MSITKIYSLCLALVFVASTVSVHAQQRIWGVSSNGELFSMRTDGSDVQSTTSFVNDAEYGHHAIGFTKLRHPRGFHHEELVFATGDSPDPQGEGYQYGAVNMITNSGIRQMTYNQYLMVNAVHGMTDSEKIDAVYAPNVGIDGKWRGFTAYSTSPNSSWFVMNKINTDYSTEFYLTNHNDTIYGVSKGDSNNKGFIYKIDENNLYLGQPTKFYNFTGGIDGQRPVGILSIGQDDLLFGYTSKGGTDDKGIFYKVKNDGTEFEKLFDVSTKAITQPEAGGKYQTLLDVIAEGYRPLTDESGNYIINDNTGIYRINPSGYLVAKLSNFSAARLQLVMPHHTSAVKVASINNGAVGVSVNQAIYVKSFPGTTKYFLEISRSADFNSEVVTLESTDSAFTVGTLEGGATYYTRARAAVWPYYGETVSFTTQSEVVPVQERLFVYSGSKLVSVNTDGSDYHFFKDEKYSPDHLIQLENGDKIVLMDAEVSPGVYTEGGVFRITANGMTNLYESVGTQDGFFDAKPIDGKDGYIYGLSYSPVGTQLSGVTTYKLDGTSVQYHRFDHEYHEIQRNSQITATPNGVYGVSKGRSSDNGCIFKLRSDFTGIDVVYQFTSSATGIRPEGAVVVGRDGYLYGTTRAGGQYNAGVIYRVSLTGTDYTILHHLEPLNGKNPTTPLIQDGDGTLYGSTTLGGKNGYGVLFKVNEDGSGFQKLLDYYFTGGKNNRGSLAVDQEFVYATGGAGLFKIKKDGSGYHALGVPATSFQKLPVTPSDLEITLPATGAVTETSLTVLTETSELATKYFLELSTSPFSGGNVMIFESDSNAFFVDSLLNDQLYYARVRSNISPAYGPMTSFTTGSSDADTIAINPENDSMDIVASASRHTTVDLYPNPSRTSFNFLANDDVESLLITDAMGNVRYQSGAIEKESRVQFGDQLQKGVYILTIQTRKSKRIVRLVKE